MLHNYIKVEYVQLNSVVSTCYLSRQEWVILKEAVKHYGNETECIAHQLQSAGYEEDSHHESTKAGEIHRLKAMLEVFSCPSWAGERVRGGDPTEKEFNNGT